MDELQRAQLIRQSLDDAKEIIEFVGTVRDLYASSLHTREEHITNLLNDGFGSGDKYLSNLALDALFSNTTHEPHSMLEALIQLTNYEPTPIIKHGKVVGCELVITDKDGILTVLDTFDCLVSTNVSDMAFVHRLHEWDAMRMKEISKEFKENYHVEEVQQS